MADNQGNQIFGRIYRIASSETEAVYIGSTTKTLNERFRGHRHQYRLYLNGQTNFTASFDIVKFEDASIELLSEGLFATKADLHRLEGEHIQLTANCINKQIAGRTRQQTIKAYNDAHKADHAAYRENRKEQYQEYMKAYRNAHKEHINQTRQQKVSCPVCHGIYSRDHKARHERSNKHKQTLSSLSSTQPSSISS